MRSTVIVVVAVLSMVSCAKKSSGPEFQKLAEEFVYKTLSFSPVTASGQGLHKYNGEDFDRQLDDLGLRRHPEAARLLHRPPQAPGGVGQGIASRRKTAPITTSSTRQIGLALFDIDIAQSWRHSPQSYVELLGSALFNPFVLEYAPKPERYEHIIARLKKIPQFLETAQVSA